MSTYKPGPGWSAPYWATPCYDHVPTGIRVHTYGLANFQDGSQVIGTTWPESAELDRFIRINGGNRKRGVMAWALSIYKLANPSKAKGEA